MTRFNIGGVYLDTPKDLSLQFVKTNDLLHQYDMEAARTAEFEIPATATNNRLLYFANDYHTAGYGMRQRYSAQMQDGVVSKSGYLYVSEYNEKERKYKCVFVFGDLLPLLDLKNKGKLSEWYETTAGAEWDGLFDTTDPIFCTYLYATQYYGVLSPAAGWHIYQSKPSIGLALLLNDAIQQAGYTTYNITLAQYAYIRMVPKTLYDSDGNEHVFRDQVELQYNLPDKTVIDLLLMIGSLAGDLVHVNSSGHVGLADTTTWSSWRSISIDGRVTECTEQKRQFLDWAQNNKIIPNVGDDDHSDAASVNYTISNSNLESVKELYAIEDLCSRQNVSAKDDNQSSSVYRTCVRPPVIDVTDEDTYLSEQTDNYIARSEVDQYGTALMCLKNAVTSPSTYIAKNAFLTSLCTQSTAMKVVCKMTLYEFDGMSAETLIIYNGCKWVWSEAQWQNGFASLELQKIS